MFVNGFKSQRSGSGETQSIDKTQVTTGAIVAGIGLGLGIAGVAVSPTHEQRSRANAARYVFSPDEIKEDELLGIVGQHNQSIQDRCQAP
jgi:hypothetical protein